MSVIQISEKLKVGHAFYDFADKEEVTVSGEYVSGPNWMLTLPHKENKGRELGKYVYLSSRDLTKIRDADLLPLRKGSKSFCRWKNSSVAFESKYEHFVTDSSNDDVFLDTARKDGLVFEIGKVKVPEFDAATLKAVKRHDLASKLTTGFGFTSIYGIGSPIMALFGSCYFFLRESITKDAGIGFTYAVLIAGAAVAAVAIPVTVAAWGAKKYFQHAAQDLCKKTFDANLPSDLQEPTVTSIGQLVAPAPKVKQTDKLATLTLG